MQVNEPTSRRSGLTIIELCVAIAVFAVASLSAMSVVTSSMKLDQESRERLWARQECRRQLEIALAKPFTDLAALNNTTFDVAFAVRSAAGVETVVTLKPPAGRAKVGLITVDSSTSGDSTCSKVTVEAKWKTGRSSGHETATLKLVANVSDF